MSYEKIGWLPGQAPYINASNLDHMDQGIKDNAIKGEENASRITQNAEKIQFVNTTLVISNWTASTDFEGLGFHYDITDSKFDASVQTIHVKFDKSTQAKKSVVIEAGLSGDGVHDDVNTSVRVYAVAIPTGDVTARIEVLK